MSRLVSRLIRYCQRLELYFKSTNQIADEEDVTLLNDVIDCMEVMLYAAAEHIDDVNSIAKGMFRNDSLAKRHAGFMRLQREIKTSKRFIAAVANSIKHSQARIRIFSIEMFHANEERPLHGFFVERVKDGVVGPSNVLDKPQNCFSVTTISWEVIVFILEASRSLRQFLEDFVPLERVEANSYGDNKFAAAVIAAARLPLYTFGEAHPFVRATMKISGPEDHGSLMESGIYGSIRHPWNKTAIPKFGKFRAIWEGDGSTKSFQIPRLGEIGLCHWD